MSLFTQADERRIAETIAAAEKLTSGEIVAVVARESDNYLYVPLMWAALIALLVPWPLIYLTWVPIATIYAVQLCVFLALLAALQWRPLRLALVPRWIKESRAHRRAVEQFLAQSMHTTRGRTGVLIFVSIAERHAEVLADSSIHQKVPEGTWTGIINDLTSHLAAGRPGDGFVRAVEASGKVLAQHFPPGTANPNELPNHLIVL